jgi:hypothetical protein
MRLCGVRLRGMRFARGMRFTGVRFCSLPGVRLQEAHARKAIGLTVRIGRMRTA